MISRPVSACRRFKSADVDLQPPTNDLLPPFNPNFSHSSIISPLLFLFIPYFFSFVSLHHYFSSLAHSMISLFHWFLLNHQVPMSNLSFSSISSSSTAKVLCQCGNVVEMKTSWTQSNPGRRFLCCKTSKVNQIYFFVQYSKESPYL